MELGAGSRGDRLVAREGLSAKSKELMADGE